MFSTQVATGLNVFFFLYYSFKEKHSHCTLSQENEVTLLLRAQNLKDRGQSSTSSSDVEALRNWRKSDSSKP